MTRAARVYLSMVVLSFALLGCNRQPVKADGSPANPATPAAAAAPIPALVFKKSIADRVWTDGGACNFDEIAGKSREEKNITLDGNSSNYDAWAAIDVEKGVLGKTVVVQLVGASTYEILAPRTKRPDTATYFKNPVMVDSGFGGRFSAKEIPSGTYELQVLIENSDGKWIRCPFRRSVPVLGSS